MHVVTKKINFNLEDVVKEEVPFMSVFYRQKGELNDDVQDLLAFPIANKEAMPFYTIKDDSTYKLGVEFSNFYKMMEYALTVAFEDEEMLYEFFDCAFLREHGEKFIPYAEYTFKERHPSLYGRFDACFNPVTEQLEGVYEFNGDTPVMLFESVNLQARLSAELGTDQYNSWWDSSLTKFASEGKNIAVACGTDYVEDMATCETVAQMFQTARSDRNVSFLDLKELDYDHMNLKKPWIAKDSDKPLDAVYILSPWEEMIGNFPQMLDHWEKWADNVTLFEPAWRWFFSNKGMMALCTYLMETDRAFANIFNSVKLIPTYLKHPMGAFGNHWVEKPVVGRLSNNIKVWDHGELQSDTGGYYSEENTVFQSYMAPYKVEGRNNFILGMWMVGADAETMCLREFDGEVLSISNERWIPHIVEA